MGRADALKPARRKDGHLPLARSELPIDTISLARFLYAHYYNEIRTHRSLNKDAPISRAIQRIGRVKSKPFFGGLHHHYVRL
jgi:hypothetical protein